MLRESSSAFSRSATNDTCHLASKETADSQSDSENSDWFGELARPLLAGADAGYALHLLTGFLAGTCARYVTKSEASRRQPPGYFIRALLRSEQGETWLAALMDGAEPKWWIAWRIERRKAALFDQAQRIFSQFG